MDVDPFIWNDSLHGDYLWSNVNFGEAITHVMTPLTWSVLRFTLKDWEYIPGLPTVGNIGGYPYLNISVFISLFKAMGRSRQDLMDEMEATLYMEIPTDMHLLAIPIRGLKLLRTFWNSGRIRMQQAIGVRRTQAYLAANLDWFQTTAARIRTTGSEQALLRLFHGEMAAHIVQGRWCVLGNATHSANYTIKLRRDLEVLIGKEDANILIANLSTEKRALTSLDPILGLSRLAEGEMSKDDYLQNFGHRGPDEFELSVPRPAEDARWLDEQIELYRQSPVDVDTLLVEQRHAFERAWQRLVTQYPQEARRFSQRIDESARRARLREAARSAYVRDRWSLRLFALQAGVLSGLGEDIFFLTLDEILGLLAGERAALRFIPGRKEIYHRCRSLPPYPPVIRGAFDPLIEAGAFSTTSVTQVSSLITGSPGSAGQVEGRVRVLADPGQWRDLQPGEILVAYQTDISWTLLFPRAAAVITDVGAPLSHAAIVARELGIPAVVGCGSATQRLKTGDRVRVNGGQGVVEILSNQV